MHLSQRSLIIAGAAAMLLGGAAIPAVALAASPPVTYYACVTTRTGAVKIVSQSATCAAGQQKISWNSIGPAGPQGPQGPPGVVTGYVGSNSSDVPLSSTANTIVATLNLPAGSFLLTAKTVVFGGAQPANDDVGCELVDSNGIIDASAAQLNSPVSNEQTIALAGATTAGGTVILSCFDGQSVATATDSVITAVPVVSVSGAVRHLPHLPIGARAGRPAG